MHFSNYLPDFIDCTAGKSFNHLKLLVSKQTLRIMKLTAILLTIVFLNVKATGVSQTVTYSGDNILLEKVFTVIKQQTGYLFLYPADAVKDAAKVSIHVKNAPLEEALDQVLKNQPLRYMIQNKTIVISKTMEAGDNKKTENKNIIAPPVDIKGRVLNHKGEPLPGANVKVKGTAIFAITNADGFFVLRGAEEDAVLEISYLGFETQTVKTDGKSIVSVQMVLEVSEMAAVSVSVYTGYQQIPKERATGSFVQVDNKLLNRSTSLDVLGRLEGVASGLAFYRNSKSDQPALNIRGRSTIFSNVQPLIVLDNFPYDGDISNINPNSVESITILRDAAAASIYGVRSANGVIVITSKKGSANKAPQVNFNTNITLGEKPDMHYFPLMQASDFIELEKDYFSKGWYTGQESAVNKAPLTPVVELLIRKRNGSISAAEADQQIEAWKQNDALAQYEKYFLRNEVIVQNALSLSGGGDRSKYFLTLSYDKDKSSAVGNSFDRFSINATNNFTPVKNLDINTGLMYTNTKLVNNNPGINDFMSLTGRKYYPYAQLVDEDGNALPTNYGYRNSYKAQMESQGAVDWQYRPFEELNMANNVTQQSYNRASLEIRKTFTPSFNLEVKYQYERQFKKQNNLQSVATYYTRNLINTYFNPSATVGTLKYPVPVGDILDQTNSELEGHTGRVQANFNQTWQKHRVNAIGGFEIKELHTISTPNRFYGYNSETAVSTPVDLVSRFPTNPQNTLIGLTAMRPIGEITDRYLSYYANGSYTYNDRYVFSASGRFDNTNYFGAEANNRLLPLWSTGVKWNISREAFFKSNLFDQLALRATYGFNGNIYKDLTAYTTVRYSADATTRATTAIVINPPNPALRWETVSMLNLGVLFTLKKNVLSGTIEYFSKKGDDLLGDLGMDPTTGITSFKSNVSNIKGEGVDVQLNGKVGMNNRFGWNPSFLFSYATDKVTNYVKTFAARTQILGGSGDLSDNPLSPVNGRPVLSIYSYRWGGLDPTTGDPLGYVDGEKSSNHADILGKATPADLVYNGPVNPTMVGAFRNDFYWNSFSVSVNITYKLGHYFRRPSVDYGQFLYAWLGNKDFANRWQKPGDEEFTNVPSLPATIPGNQNNREYRFYANSAVLVEKADHIRLQDIVLGYDLEKEKIHRLPFQRAHIYCNMNNLGILWRANKYGIDPDAVPFTETRVLPQPRSVTLGARFDF
ncbi:MULTISPECIES: SusC/RagA family TonB-linked outer membrane protein [Niastella]|uniref:SusC/RagA family TonB-linked outer membrane protein n=1 Tax=Niastella soli TaxID=2821487 RepID=A0ABS3YYF5_9BACT|nr:SusC/RagA family TonB-linked outer membrane protein [Niastella soli]MBO9202950.1 SusC/RagA family TonB-linked outer membrane protein [Niastella soli]